MNFGHQMPPDMPLQFFHSQMKAKADGIGGVGPNGVMMRSLSSHPGFKGKPGNYQRIALNNQVLKTRKNAADDGAHGARRDDMNKLST